jgi:hypothetical protein
MDQKNTQIVKTILAYQPNRSKGRPNGIQELINILTDYGGEADLKAPLYKMTKMVDAHQKSTYAFAYVHNNAIGSRLSKTSGEVKLNDGKCVEC